MPKLILPILLLSLVLTGTSAQDKAPKPQPKPAPEDDPYVKRFNELDRNRDGFISPAEWPLDPASFPRVDRDQDGRLSRAELLTPNLLRPNPMQRFRLLDTNHDGRLSREERQREGTTLDRLDRNADGVVSLREYDDAQNLADTWSPRATVREQQHFQSLDRNRDNRLTRTEWTGSGASFQQHDRNRDGVISPREWPGR